MRLIEADMSVIKELMKKAKENHGDEHHEVWFSLVPILFGKNKIK